MLKNYKGRLIDMESKTWPIKGRPWKQGQIGGNQEWGSRWGENWNKPHRTNSPAHSESQLYLSKLDRYDQTGRNRGGPGQTVSGLQYWELFQHGVEQVTYEREIEDLDWADPNRREYFADGELPDFEVLG
tara:strand:- start:9223 stop:9612 length:390 start_codon:yes stop_codon:yes gene_type:complete